MHFQKGIFLCIVCGSLLCPLGSRSQTKPVVQTKQVIKQSGRAIQITLKPYRDTKIYLGTNYGRNRVLADSTVLNANSEGVFKSKEKLTPGIYFIVSPTYNILFEFLVDANQQFKIIADTLALNKFQIIGSAENDLFLDYSKFMAEYGTALNAIENNFKNAKTAADSAMYKAAYEKKDSVVKAKRVELIATKPKSMMRFFLDVMNRPTAPKIPIVNGIADSAYPFYYVKNHYWDNILFNDNRLIRTPFFEDKLDEYFKNYVSPNPDSIKEEVNYMLTVAKTGKEIYPFLLFKFTNKYINPEFMGQDKVFLHIFENFFAKGDTILLNAASKKTITERAYSIMANQLGNAAPVLNLTGIDNTVFSLYNQKADYTFLVFWDPTCSHCKTEVPRIDSIYNASWKNFNVQLVGVNINFNEINTWKNFIVENKLNKDWRHVYQTEAANNKEIMEGKPSTIRQLYDVFKTPTFYLLDANKKILAKNLSIEQFDNFLKSTKK